MVGELPTSTAPQPLSLSGVDLEKGVGAPPQFVMDEMLRKNQGILGRCSALWTSQVSKPFKLWAFKKGEAFTAFYSRVYIRKYLMKYFRKQAKEHKKLYAASANGGLPSASSSTKLSANQTQTAQHESVGDKPSSLNLYTLNPHPSSKHQAPSSKHRTPIPKPQAPSPRPLTYILP